MSEVSLVDLISNNQILSSLYNEGDALAQMILKIGAALVSVKGVKEPYKR
ncbi:MAG: hypothetical protein K2X81_24475 [Candidatus Obscuribacterales bacterium]|nr:hypothetical protein [Candidatus Obscuribacterales bacterium]